MKDGNGWTERIPLDGEWSKALKRGFEGSTLRRGPGSEKCDSRRASGMRGEEKPKDMIEARVIKEKER